MTFIEFKEQYKKLENDEERNLFISNRINELLSNTNEVDRIGMNICGSFDKFISPKTGVSSNSTPIFSDLSLDDMNVYQEFMNYIQNDVDKYLFGEPSTINVIQQFIWKYFGYNAGNVFQRMDIYSNNPDKKLSVKELKGNNIGACSERSALVQNILQFLGFESELMFGKLNETESHAYIVFKAGNGKTRILYDPMNPVVYMDNEKENYCPGVCLLSEEDYEKLKNGQSFTFDYSLTKKLFIRDRQCYEDERKYTCDDKLFLKDNLKQIREEYIKMIEDSETFDSTMSNENLSESENKGIRR